MNRPIKTVIPMLLVATLASTAQGASVPKVVRDYVAAQGKIQKGDPIIRKVVRGDLDADGDSDLAVWFAVQGAGGGGNLTSFSITVFRNTSGRLTRLTNIDAGSFGTATGRQLQLTSIRKGRIFADFTMYAGGDGVCCPSVHGKTSFTLIGARAVEHAIFAITSRP